MTQSSKRKTKKEELIQLLSRSSGSDVATISDKFGWQTRPLQSQLSSNEVA